MKLYWRPEQKGFVWHCVVWEAEGVSRRAGGSYVARMVSGRSACGRRMAFREDSKEAHVLHFQRCEVCEGVSLYLGMGLEDVAFFMETEIRESVLARTVALLEEGPRRRLVEARLRVVRKTPAGRLTELLPERVREHAERFGHGKRAGRV